MKRLVFIPYLLLSFCSHAQYFINENKVWAFGVAGGLDFNSGVPVAISTAMDTYESSASVCDENGVLLFSTEGSSIWDAEYDLMPNGTGLVGPPGWGGLYTTISTTQGATIIPVPDTPGKYYLFSLTSFENGIGKLYYSVVNMSLNGGKGDVEPGRKGIFMEDGLSEKMIAIRGSHCNLWLLVHSNNTQTFNAYEINSSGINMAPVTSTLGTVPAYFYTAGVMKASPDGKRIATCNAFGGVELFDFDPGTGIVSNVVQLSNAHHYGASFSPGGSKLYVNASTGDIYQYDLSLATTAAIINSRTLVGTNGYIQGSDALAISDLRIGPDGKIYLGLGNTNQVHVIQLPDVAGTGCQLVNNVLQLTAGSLCMLSFPSEMVRLVTDSTGSRVNLDLCFSDSLKLHANDLTGWDYQWEDGTTGLDLDADTSGIYILHYHTSPCVYHSDTFSVSFLSPPFTAGMHEGCKEAGDGYLWILMGGGDSTSYIYSWKDSSGSVVGTHTGIHTDTLSGIPPGVYTLELHGGNGCDTGFNMELTAPDYQASFTTDTLLCIGGLLQTINLSHGFSDFIWDFGDGNTSALNSPSHLYEKPGNYHILLTGYPCMDTMGRNVVVDSMSYLSFVADSLPVCEGRLIRFYPAYSQGAAGLNWDFGDGTQAADSWLPVHAYDSSGVWTVKGSAHFRVCPDTSSELSVTIHPYPVVDLGNDTSLCVDGVPLILMSRVGVPASYTSWWNTGDSSRQITAGHPGIYALTLNSEYGCATTDSIAIEKNCYLDIPNAFTPNGDGNNDYFFPRQDLSRQLTKFRMQIFNRWGQLIFETDRLNGRGWDGRFNEKDQPSGVYIYLVEAEIDGKQQERYKGNLTLLR